MTPDEIDGELEWVIPIGLLTSEFDCLPNVMEQYHNRLGLTTDVMEVSLYDGPGKSF